MVNRVAFLQHYECLPGESSKRRGLPHWRQCPQKAMSKDHRFWKGVWGREGLIGTGQSYGGICRWEGGCCTIYGTWLGASEGGWGWGWCATRACCEWEPWQLSSAHSGACPGLWRVSWTGLRSSNPDRGVMKALITVSATVSVSDGQSGDVFMVVERRFDNWFDV